MVFSVMAIISSRYISGDIAQGSGHAKPSG